MAYTHLARLLFLLFIGWGVANTTAAQTSPSHVIAVGLVESIDREQLTLTIEGIPFDLSDADISSEAALAVGARVRVRFAVDRSGLLRASQLDLASSNETAPLILAGTVTDLSEDRIQLGRISLYTGQATFTTAVQLEDRVLLRFRDDVEGVVVTEVRPVERLSDVGRATDDSTPASVTPPSLPFTVVDLDDPRYDDVFNNADVTDNSDEDSVGCAVPTGWHGYTVRRGDTLGGIATAARTTTNALMNANCITNANFIRVGDVIYIPVKISSVGGNNNDDDNDNDDNDNDDDNSDDNGDGDDGGDDRDDNGGGGGDGGDGDDDDDDDDGDDD